MSNSMGSSSDARNPNNGHILTDKKNTSLSTLSFMLTRVSVRVRDYLPSNTRKLINLIFHRSCEANIFCEFMPVNIKLGEETTVHSTLPHCSYFQIFLFPLLPCAPKFTQNGVTIVFLFSILHSSYSQH